MNSGTSLTIEQVLGKYSAGPDTGIFTDGGARPNPGAGGWGYVYVQSGVVVRQGHGSMPNTTNNRMELTAILEAVRAAPTDQPLKIYSDSNLCVQTFNSWVKSWERSGWKRKQGEIANLDLVKQVYAELGAKANLELVWIKAHNGWLWNEYADSLSAAWCRDQL